MIIDIKEPRKDNHSNIEKALTKQRIDSCLKQGYHLTISYDKLKDTIHAALIKRKSDFNIEDIIEINANYILSSDSHLKQYLKQTFCTFGTIYYDHKTRKFIGGITKKNTEGPYCEFAGYELIEETKIDSESLFELISLLETNTIPPKTKKLSLNNWLK